MKLTAPIHTSDVSISTGTYVVVDGSIEIPDDTPASDLAGLAANGFTPAAEPAPKAAPKPTPTPAPTA